jgi:hypothetical protein
MLDGVLDRRGRGADCNTKADSSLLVRVASVSATTSSSWRSRVTVELSEPSAFSSWLQYLRLRAWPESREELENELVEASGERVDLGAAGA